MQVLTIDYRARTTRASTIGRSFGGTANLFRCSQNAFAESFIGRLRDELLNETLFRSLPHVSD